jgi:hypothetical protein
MHKHFRSGATYFLAAAVLISAGLTAGSTDAFAKHKKASATTSSSDPCAEPTAFIHDHVAKIRTLKAQLGSHASTVVGLFGSSSTADEDANAKIAELRHDADGVNDLLNAGGCKTIDIDQEIKGENPAATHKASF